MTGISTELVSPTEFLTRTSIIALKFFFTFPTGRVLLNAGILADPSIIAVKSKQISNQQINRIGGHVVYCIFHTHARIWLMKSPTRIRECVISSLFALL